ncbi:hypothetical protein M0R04_04400 [Candidatus Dojkabacteria bacterium]|jgi:hypothetical protein|nr:hypothetical protein [Candidatus Dojkabacteria bacterium]
MKNYIGISRDHSGSMSHITGSAMRDYNETINSIKTEATKYDIDTIVSVVKCGVGRPAKVVRDVVNSNINSLKPLTDYRADGNSTPLFDSIGDLIEMFKRVPDYNDDTVAFLITVITDGEENSSEYWNAQSISREIIRLQKTDKWTFTFRVPKGSKRRLIGMGIPEGNILEWEQSERGMEKSTQATNVGMTQFYAGRATGQRSSKSFYADMSNINISEVKRNLVDISKEIEFLKITRLEDGMQIRDFVQDKKGTYNKGTAFYQLTKSETLQDYKMIIILDKFKGHVYSGDAARDLLGLPKDGSVRFRPGDHGQYEIYVQSTSVNRKIQVNTNLLIWMNANK